jgi:sugar lactone lactonase YvrE
VDRLLNFSTSFAQCRRFPTADLLMKPFFLLMAMIFFAVGAAHGQTVEAYNTSVLAGRSSALGVVDGAGGDARFQSITSMWGDGVNLYVANAATIRRVELATAQVSTLSRTASTGIHRFGSNSGFGYNYGGLYGLWSDGASLYGTDIGAGTIRKIDLTTGGVQTVASGLGFAWGLWGSGTKLYAASAASGTVIQVDAITGMQSQLASTGSGTPWDCHLGSGCIGYFVPGPRSMWGDGQSLYITGYSGTVKKLDIASGGQTFLPSVPFNIGPITSAAGLLFVGAISGPQLGSVRIDTGEFTPIALPADRLSITALWGDGVGLYVAEGSVIRRVDLATGNVTEFAGVPQVAEFANGIGPQARFSAPKGLWADGQTLYVADSANFSIRRVDSATGAVTQVAGASNVSAIQDGTGTNATFSEPKGVWGDGNSLYITDAQSIRRVALDTTEVTTIAGTGTISGAQDGVGTQAQFANPTGLLGSGGGTLYIADTSNGVIRQLNTASNQVTTFAGSFGAFGIIDGSLDVARFRVPTALWSDNINLYVADLNYIRAISLGTGMVRTVATLPTVGLIKGLWGNGSSLYTFAVSGVPYAHTYLYRIAIDTGAVSQVVHGNADAETGMPIFFPGASAIWGNDANLFVTDDSDNTVRLLARDTPPSLIRTQITDPG